MSRINKASLQTNKLSITPTHVISITNFNAFIPTINNGGYIDNNNDNCNDNKNGNNNSNGNNINTNSDDDHYDRCNDNNCNFTVGIIMLILIVKE